MLEPNDEVLMPIPGVDYEFCLIGDARDAESKNPTVKLLCQEYQNIIVQYGTIQFLESVEPGSPPTMRFDFRVIDWAGHNPESFVGNEDFRNYLGHVITQCVFEYVESIKNGNRNPDSEGIAG